MFQAEKDFKDAVNEYDVDIVPRANAQLIALSSIQTEFIRDNTTVLNMAKDYVNSYLPAHNETVADLVSKARIAISDKNCRDLESIMSAAERVADTYIDRLEKMTASIESQITKWDSTY